MSDEMVDRTQEENDAEGETKLAQEENGDAQMATADDEGAAKESKGAEGSGLGGGLDLWAEFKLRAEEEEKLQALEAENREKLKEEEEERKQKEDEEAEAKQKEIDAAEDAEWQEVLKKREEMRKEILAKKRKREEEGMSNVPVKTAFRSAEKAAEFLSDFGEEKGAGMDEEDDGTKKPTYRVQPEKGDYASEMMGIQYKAQGGLANADDTEDTEEKTEEGGEVLPRKLVMYFREPCAPKIIGRAAGNIRKLRQDSGADLKTVKKPQYVEVTITGEPAYVQKAKLMVIECAGEQPDPSLEPPKPLE